MEHKAPNMISLRATMMFYASIFMLGVFLTSGAVYLIVSRSLVSEVDSRLSTESVALLGQRGGRNIAEVKRRISERERRKGNDLSYLLVDKAQSRIAGNLAMRVPQPGFSDLDFTDGVEGIDHGRALTARLPDGGRLLVIADYGPLEDLNQRLLQVGAIALAAIITIGMLAGFAFSRSIGRRIEANARAAESIMVGRMDERMLLDGSGGAFDRQAAVLNKMLDRIQTLVTHLQHISSEVAHDLRSPLSVLRSNLALLASRHAGQINPADIEKALVQCDKILSLFKAILRIAEIEDGSRRAFFKVVDLDELVGGIVATYLEMVEASGQRLELGRVDRATTVGDSELIAQALINLVENAIKHAGTGARILMSVECTAYHVTMTVRDDGRGIAPQDRVEALRRFGRLDGSRASSGNGLGLSIVDAIARLHGGQFVLDDAKPGLIAAIRLAYP